MSSTISEGDMYNFAVKNGFFAPHQLHSVPIVLDCTHLATRLHECYLESHADQFYGGDYAHLAAYFERFFQSLQSCGVKPLLLFDYSAARGSCDSTASEAENYEFRCAKFDEQIETARAIAQGRVPANERSLAPRLKSSILLAVIGRLGLRHFAATETRPLLEVLAQVAIDLKGAPIVSDNANLLLHNIPGGLIRLDSLLQPPEGLRVQVGDRAVKFVQCQIVKFDSIQRKFAGIRADLLPLANVLLTFDRTNAVDDGQLQEFRRIIASLPSGGVSNSALSSRSMAKSDPISHVVGWIATQDSLSSALNTLKRLGGDARSNLVVKKIHERVLAAPRPSAPGFVTWPRLDKYIADNRDKLFPLSKTGFPKRVATRIMHCQLPRRLARIFKTKVEFLRPLVEDFNSSDSCYDVSQAVREAIYTLLRDGTDPLALKNHTIQCHRRKAAKRTEESIKALDERPYARLLPSLEELSAMSDEERIDLFFEILALDCTLIDECRQMIERLNLVCDSHLRSALGSILLCTIYFVRHYPQDLWIEFVMALIGNLLLTGHITPGEDFAVSPCSCATLLPPLDKPSLVEQLSRFGTLVPRIIPAYAFKPRIPHFYNSFQVVLWDISLLAQILDVPQETFQCVPLLMGLQGSFLYNLTIDLLAHSAPLVRLEQDILGGEHSAPLEAWRTVLCFVLHNAERRFAQELTEGSVIPHNLCKPDNNSNTNLPMFIRGPKNCVAPATIRTNKQLF